MGQGQSIPGPAGPRGDTGPQGPPGTPGKDASGDPQQVASFLLSNGAFSSQLAPIVAKDNAIGTTVAENIANNQIPRQLVTNALITSKTFSDKLIDSMATDIRFRGVQGPPGSAFDEISIQGALQPKSMWCADGQMCRIPTSTPGTYLTGDTVIQRSKNLYLGGATVGTSGGLLVDNKHGIIVKDNNPVDGPFMFGNTGGSLGTFDQVTSTTTPSATLTWDNNDITVKNNIKQKGFDFKLGFGDTTRGDSGESRALVKEKNNTLKINFEGDYAGGTTVDGPNLNVSNGVLKLGKWTIDGSGDDIKFSNKDNSQVATITSMGSLIINDYLYLGGDNKWRLNGNDKVLYVDKKKSDGTWAWQYGTDDEKFYTRKIRTGKWTIIGADDEIFFDHDEKKNNNNWRAKVTKNGLSINENLQVRDIRTGKWTIIGTDDEIFFDHDEKKNNNNWRAKVTKNGLSINEDLQVREIKIGHTPGNTDEGPIIRRDGNNVQILNKDLSIVFDVNNGGTISNVHDINMGGFLYGPNGWRIAPTGDWLEFQKKSGDNWHRKSHIQG